MRTGKFLMPAEDFGDARRSCRRSTRWWNRVLPEHPERTNPRAKRIQPGAEDAGGADAMDSIGIEERVLLRAGDRLDHENTFH